MKTAFFKLASRSQKPHVSVVPGAREPNAPHANAETALYAIDFSSQTDTFTSIPLAVVKRPSKALPSDFQITILDSVHHGAKAATGSSAFYNLLNRIKSVFGLCPPERGGKCADIAKVARNDARTLYWHTQALHEQFNHVMADDKLTPEEKRHAACLAVYFLGTCHENLVTVLEKLKMYDGLARGHARVGYGGLLVAGKTPPGESHPDFVKSEARKAAEARLLGEIAKETPLFKAALSRLGEVGLSAEDFHAWKAKNATDIEVSLNRSRGVGGITGVTIQGLVTAAINFGIGAATMNPIVFAAGAYYAVSAAVRVAETATKTGAQTRLLRDGKGGPNEVKIWSQVNAIETVERFHCHVDGLANSAFGAAATMAPLATGRPANMTEANVGPHKELQRLERPSTMQVGK